MKERDLLAALRNQGFEVRPVTGGHVVKSPEGRTKALHSSAFDQSNNGVKYRRMMSDLKRIGFDPEANGSKPKRGEGKTSASPLAMDMPVYTEKHGARYRILKTSELTVDKEYQRTVRMSHAKDIAANLNLLALGCLVVSEREDGSLVVVDGQHRLTAVRMRGWDEDGREIACLVAKGLTHALEAQLFMGLNNTKALLAYDHWKARVAAGDPTAIAVRDTCAKYGVEVMPTSSRGKMGARRTSSVASLYEAQERGVLDRTFRLIAKAWGISDEGDPYTLSSAILKMTWRALTVPEWETLIDLDHAAEALSRVTPNQMVTAAQKRSREESALGLNVDVGKEMIGQFRKLYNFKLRPANQLPSGPEIPGRHYGRS